MDESKDSGEVVRIGPIGERLQLVIDHYRLNMNKLSIKLALPSNSIITRIVKDPGRGSLVNRISLPLLPLQVLQI